MRERPRKYRTVGGRRKLEKATEEWQLYLEGKTPLNANDLSPKEATQMSHDVKYIGMDVHKEATVIAVLNGSGKLVMESIVETKASSILQFIHGLRGELHVTWEEGSWAAWLYDLLQPHVAQGLVCDPRRNALLKEGNKIDARKLADLLRTGMLRPVYHGEHGLRTLRELGRSYRTISQDLNRVMNRIKALYRGWSIPLCRYPSVCSTLSRGMVTQDRASRGAPASRVAVPTVGWIAGVAANPATRVIGGEPET
jgi:Transposase